jgi:hypothetical protein
VLVVVLALVVGVRMFPPERIRPTDHHQPAALAASSLTAHGLVALGHQV